MTDDEKEYLKLVVQSSVSVAIKPLTDELAEHSLSIQRVTQTVYGATGENGLRGDMKSVKGDIKDLQNTKVKVLAWASGAGATVSGAILLIKSFIKGG